MTAHPPSHALRSRSPAAEGRGVHRGLCRAGRGRARAGLLRDRSAVDAGRRLPRRSSRSRRRSPGASARCRASPSRWPSARLALHTLFGLGQHGTPLHGSAADAPTTALISMAARLVCGAGAASLSPAEAQRILTDARASAAGTAVHGPQHHGHADAVDRRPPPAVDAAAAVPAHAARALLAALATGWLLRRGDLALLRLVRLSAHGRVAEGALVRPCAAALALVRALRAGSRARPRRARAPRAPTARTAAPPRHRTPAHGDPARPARRRSRSRRLTRRTRSSQH